MIYLIDDKKQRQEIDYGWDAERLSKYNQYIKPIYSYEEIKDKEERNEIFKTGNIILFHESFFDNSFNLHTLDSSSIRNRLAKEAEENKLWVAFFSGSKTSRYLNGQLAHLPVSILYKNLEEFILSQIEKDIDFKTLLYGVKNAEIEEILLEKLNEENGNFDVDELQSSKSNFLLTNDNRQNIPISITNTHFEDTYIEESYDNQISDIFLNDSIIKWFSEKEYDNIFIPLCFGSTLSDFNGLRLASNIRCTYTRNQLKPIFIYSFVDYADLINNEYFNILRTKNIFLINYDRKSFKNALELKISDFGGSELSNEMQKLKLDPPQNYFDNHSIANEWGVYQMARNANVNIDEVSGFDKVKLISTYFKWLITINKLDEPIPEIQIKEQKNYAEELSGIKILGKIDLSKFKK